MKGNQKQNIPHLKGIKTCFRYFHEDNHDLNDVVSMLVSRHLRVQVFFKHSTPSQKMAKQIVMYSIG